MSNFIGERVGRDHPPSLKPINRLGFGLTMRAHNENPCLSPAQVLECAYGTFRLIDVANDNLLRTRSELDLKRKRPPRRAE